MAERRAHEALQPRFDAVRDRLLGRLRGEDPPLGYVIRIVDLGGYLTCAMSGQYVSAFDVEAAEGVGMVVSTPTPGEAILFPSVVAARECYETQSKLRPVRFDGGLNRPMTRFRVVYEWVRVGAGAMFTGKAE